MIIVISYIVLIYVAILPHNLVLPINSSFMPLNYTQLRSLYPISRHNACTTAVVLLPFLQLNSQSLSAKCDMHACTVDVTVPQRRERLTRQS